MKNENVFNRFFSGELIKQPSTHYLKASDRFTGGVSDFIIWRGARSTVVENKFITDWPSDRAKLLTHVFTGPQRTFLESVYLTGCRALGLVAIGKEKRFFVMDYKHIPESGNWKTGDFKAKGFHAYPFQCVDKFLDVWL